MSTINYIAARSGIFADGKGTPCYQISKLRSGGSYSFIGTASRLAEDAADVAKLNAAGHGGEDGKAPCNAPVTLEVCNAKIALLEGGS